MFLRSHRQHGFTLIEIMMVIAIIAMLVSVVLVALNPSKQIANAQDKSRLNDVDKLRKAMSQYQIDFGVLPQDASWPSIAETPKPVCAPGKVNAACVNLDAQLVTAYLTSIPHDANEVNPNFSGYKVAKSTPVPVVVATNMNHTEYGLDNGLVGHWNFETLGNIAYDASLSGNNGSMTGVLLTSSVPKTTFPDTKSASFSAATYMITGNPAALQLSNGTVSAWINVPVGGAGAGYRGIVTKRSAYSMYLLNNVFGVYDWGANLGRSSGVSLNDGKWHHVAYTFQSGVANGTTLYIDGVAIVSTTTSVSNQTLAVAVGAGGPVGGIELFTGSIDDARIYNRLLTAVEIAALAKGEG